MADGMPRTPFNQYTMRDPRDMYAKPPFQQQPQDKPGIEAVMDPVPDDGAETYQGHGRLSGRKALITGGDSGIGRAVAIAYAREGADVVINYLPAEEDDAQSLKGLLENEGTTIHLMPGDLSDKEFATNLVRSAHNSLGGLDILVLNAGKQVSQDDIENISDDQFDQTMKTNIYAMFWMTRAALPLMPSGASIITTSSIQAFNPSPNLLDYATTKFAIRGFTQDLSQQAIKRGIRVNSVAPGPIWTVLQPSGGQPQEKVETFGQNTPMGRPGQPAELAPTYVFLASQESSYINGEIIGVTGGKLMS